MFSCSLIVSSMQFRSWHECNRILPKQSPSLSLIQYSLLTQNVIYQYFQAFSLSLLFDFSLFLSLLAKLGSSLISAINLWDPHMLSYTCKHILSHGKMSVIVIKGVCSSRADETRLEMEFERQRGHKRCTDRSISANKCQQINKKNGESLQEVLVFFSISGCWPYFQLMTIQLWWNVVTYMRQRVVWHFWKVVGDALWVFFKCTKPVLYCQVFLCQIINKCISTVVDCIISLSLKTPKLVKWFYNQEKCLCFQERFSF